MIKLLTFDLDNTLWPVEDVIQRAIQKKFQWLAQHHPLITDTLGDKDFINIRNRLISHNPQIIADFTLLRKKTIEEAAVQVGIKRKEAEIISLKAFDIFFEERNRVVLFPDVAAVLKSLSKNYQLIALTNGNADLKIIGIDQYFSAHFKPLDVGAPKPEPEIFQLALKTAGVKANECIHIGDDLVCDIQGAKNVGMLTIFANILKKHSPESEALADASIQYLHELPAAVKKFN